MAVQVYIVSNDEALPPGHVRMQLASGTMLPAEPIQATFDLVGVAKVWCNEADKTEVYEVVHNSAN